MLCILLFYVLSLLITQPFTFLKYYQARLFSIILISLISYVLSFFFPFKYIFYITLSIFTAISVYIVVKNGRFRINHDEIVFLIVFLYFIFLRSLVPDVFGSEKFMDIAFINSILKSKSFPPNDPYFAGGKLDIYYFFGHVIGAVITSTSFTKTEVGYNIAMAAIPAFSSLTLFGFLKEFRTKYATLGLIFVLFSGNLYAASEFFYKISKMQSIDFLYYWNATRVIKDSTFGYAITEFPYFSFIHADFHAHVVAIPITILCLSMIYDFYRGDESKSYLLPILLFALFATNPWSVPVIFALIATLFVNFKNKRKLMFALILSTILITFLYINIKNASSKLSFTTERTDLFQFIEFFGIQIVFAYYYFYNSENKLINKRNIILILSPLSYFFVPIGVVLLPLLIISFKKALKGDYLSCLIFTACITILSVEFLMIDCRMNTIFKFYLVSWLLLTIPAATKLEKMFKIKTKANAVMLVLFVLSLTYPVFATPVRHYNAEMSLDGLRFMEKQYMGDYKAINWLRDKDGYIVEAVCDCYTYCSRISTFSGNPTVIAWPCHEVHWRGDVDEIIKRMNDVKSIYTSKNCSEVTKLIEKYKIRFVIVGDEERRIYKTNGSIFEQCGFKKVLKGETEIFESIRKPLFNSAITK